ncbi:class I SAM-dependent methyltransferase [Nocardia sp. NBC_00403]|uniref:class I SAM-dependent methyltransferase n=1 Tax=Nocardia sp. NBC_00403 TaxID=2975990 RepID=UPI003FA5499B
MVDRGNRVGPDSNRVFDYDAELRHYHQRLRDAIDVAPDDNVLDIGCGAGQTTRDAARLAIRGSALGVDASSVMVARARRLGAAEGLQCAIRAGGCTGPSVPTGAFHSRDQSVRHHVLRRSGRGIDQHRARATARGAAGATGLAGQ